MGLNSGNVSLVKAVIQKLICTKNLDIFLSAYKNDIFRINVNELCTKLSDDTAREVNSNSKDHSERKNIIIKKHKADNYLFGSVIKNKKKENVKFVSEQSGTSETLSHNNELESELQWVLRTSNAKHIKRLNITKQNITKKVEFTDDRNVKSDEYLDNKINKIESSETPNYISKNLSQSVHNIVLPKELEDVTLFPISGSKSLDNENIWHRESNENLYIPSVTRILQNTMSEASKQALEQWKKNMIEKLGLEQFDIYCKELLKNGRLFHSCIEDTLLQKEITVPSEVELAYSSVQPVLCNIETVKNLETHVLHPNLQYKGVVDCIAFYRGNLCIIDWKKSDKQKLTLASTFDAPLQVAAYIGAVNASDNYPFKVDRGLIVVAYTDGKPATIHEVKDRALELAWRNWLKRLRQHYVNTNEQKLGNTV
ncbi:uncharacterized protein LOC143186974 [Calliopsis andreniformis]|uniref:uncharacterized protein LOC143186974 n=1 Tax=Calliopsis andreniformis TaxID=337506 RepID=UPI003FCC516B